MKTEFSDDGCGWGDFDYMVWQLELIIMILESKH